MRDIEDLYLPEDIIEEVRRQNSQISLDDFFIQDDDNFDIEKYGLYVITPHQDFCCMARKNHEDAMTNILFALYGDAYNKMMPMCDYDWILTANKLNNVFVQLMSKYYCLIWVPFQINSFQRDKLISFYNMAVKVNNDLKSNGYDSINFEFNIKDSAGKNTVYTFEEGVSLLDSLVYSDIDIKDEQMIDEKKIHTK